VLIWAGVFVIEYYTVSVLTQKCAAAPPSSTLEYLAKARNAVVAFLLLITCAPLILGMWQMKKFARSYQAEQKLLTDLTSKKGRLIAGTGSTRLFDATFNLGEIAGYAGYHRQGATAEPRANFDRGMSDGAF
jgi:hypothetical protein